jgi:hypothetical protein
MDADDKHIVDCFFDLTGSPDWFSIENIICKDQRVIDFLYGYRFDTPYWPDNILGRMWHRYDVQRSCQDVMHALDELIQIIGKEKAKLLLLSIAEQEGDILVLFMDSQCGMINVHLGKCILDITQGFGTEKEKSDLRELILNTDAFGQITFRTTGKYPMYDDEGISDVERGKFQALLALYL